MLIVRSPVLPRAAAHTHTHAHAHARTRTHASGGSSSPQARLQPYVDDPADGADAPTNTTTGAQRQAPAQGDSSHAMRKRRRSSLSRPSLPGGKRLSGANTRRVSFSRKVDVRRFSTGAPEGDGETPTAAYEDVTLDLTPPVKRKKKGAATFASLDALSPLSLEAAAAEGARAAEEVRTPLQPMQAAGDGTPSALLVEFDPAPVAASAPMPPVSLKDLLDETASAQPSDHTPPAPAPTDGFLDVDLGSPVARSSAASAAPTSSLAPPAVALSPPGGLLKLLHRPAQGGDDNERDTKLASGGGGPLRQSLGELLRMTEPAGEAASPVPPRLADMRAGAGGGGGDVTNTFAFAPTHPSAMFTPSLTGLLRRTAPEDAPPAASTGIRVFEFPVDGAEEDNTDTLCAGAEADGEVTMELTGLALGEYADASAAPPRAAAPPVSLVKSPRVSNFLPPLAFVRPPSPAPTPLKSLLRDIESRNAVAAASDSPSLVKLLEIQRRMSAERASLAVPQTAAAPSAAAAAAAAAAPAPAAADQAECPATPTDAPAPGPRAVLAGSPEPMDDLSDATMTETLELARADPAETTGNLCGLLLLQLQARRQSTDAEGGPFADGDTRDAPCDGAGAVAVADEAADTPGADRPDEGEERGAEEAEGQEDAEKKEEHEKGLEMKERAATSGKVHVIALAAPAVDAGEEAEAEAEAAAAAACGWEVRAGASRSHLSLRFRGMIALEACFGPEKTLELSWAEDAGVFRPVIERMMRATPVPRLLCGLSTRADVCVCLPELTPHCAAIVDTLTELALLDDRRSMAVSPDGIVRVELVSLSRWGKFFLCFDVGSGTPADLTWEVVPVFGEGNIPAEDVVAAARSVAPDTPFRLSHIVAAAGAVLG